MYPTVDVPRAVKGVLQYFSDYYVNGRLRRDGTFGTVRFPTEEWNIHDVVSMVNFN